MGFSLRARGLRCGAKDRLCSCCSGAVSMVQLNARVAMEGLSRGFDWPGRGAGGLSR